MKHYNLWASDEHHITHHLIIECENNFQPVVFIKNTQSSTFRYDEIKMTGVPLNVTTENHPSPISIDEYLEFDNFHHYTYSGNYTQYCSFQLPNKQNATWIASHLETQHDSFSNLIKCVEFKRHNYFTNNIWPLQGAEEKMDLHFFYPIVVLQGELFQAIENDGDLKMEPIKWLSFRKQTIRNQEVSSYKIDVITEKFFPTFLEILENEKNGIIGQIRDHWDKILISMSHKTHKARQMRTHREAYGIPYGGPDNLK